MRVSADKNDPGYRNDFYLYHVFLNGEEIKDCITADEEKGEVICYVTDGNNNLVAAHDEIMVTTEHGTVEIIKRDTLQNIDLVK